MSNNYAPCFNRINFVVIPLYIELLWNPANLYLFKFNNRTTRKGCEMYSKLTIKPPERRRSGVFIVKFKHISQLFLVFLLLNLNK